MNGDTNVEPTDTPTGELGFFFGRPPPSWTITDDELDDIRQRLDGLTTTDEPSPFPRMGPVAYRVFNLPGSDGLPDEIYVQDGIVETRVGSTYAYYTDDNQLEQMLRTSATSAGAYAQLGLDDSP